MPVALTRKKNTSRHCKVPRLVMRERKLPRTPCETYSSAIDAQKGVRGNFRAPTVENSRAAWQRRKNYICLIWLPRNATFVSVPWPCHCWSFCAHRLHIIRLLNVHTPRPLRPSYMRLVDSCQSTWPPALNDAMWRVKEKECADVEIFQYVFYRCNFLQVEPPHHVIWIHLSKDESTSSTILTLKFNHRIYFSYLAHVVIPLVVVCSG